MEPREREIAVHVLEGRLGGHHVERGEGAHLRGVVERHAVADASTAIVPHHVKAIEAERRHRLDLVPRRGALAMVVEVVGSGLAAVAVAAQVRCHHGVVRREPGRHLVPHGMGLRVAVEQQERRALATFHQIDGDGRGLDPGPGEVVEHACVFRLQCHCGHSALSSCTFSRAGSTPAIDHGGDDAGSAVLHRDLCSMADIRTRLDQRRLRHAECTRSSAADPNGSLRSDRDLRRPKKSRARRSASVPRLRLRSSRRTLFPRSGPRRP